MKITRLFFHALSVTFLFYLAAAIPVRADDLISLDDPSPISDVGAPTGGDAEVDLGGGDTFNPYTFARSGAWAALPIAALILVGLHLLRVPKRKSKRKIDQARRFFRGISGEGTNTAIPVPPKGEK